MCEMLVPSLGRASAIINSPRHRSLEIKSTGLRCRRHDTPQSFSASTDENLTLALVGSIKSNNNIHAECSSYSSNASTAASSVISTLHSSDLVLSTNSSTIFSVRVI